MSPVRPKENRRILAPSVCAWHAENAHQYCQTSDISIQGPPPKHTRTTAESSLGPRLFLSFPPPIYYAKVLYYNPTTAIGRKSDVDSASLVFGNMLKKVCFHVSGTPPVKSALRNKCDKASNMTSGEWCRSSATTSTSSAGSSAFNRVTAFLSSAKVRGAYSMHVKISCHCADQFRRGGGPTMQRTTFRNWTSNTTLLHMFSV